MNALTFAEGYRELSETLGVRDSRKLCHNTYLRRDGSDLVIRFHSTDVLRYHNDGTVSLRANGWHTATTARRFSDWLPRLWSVGNDRGVWNLFGPTGERREYGTGDWKYTAPVVAAHFRFWDGMRVMDDPRVFLVNYRDAPDFNDADRLARELELLIGRYVRGYSNDVIRELYPLGQTGISLAGDCFYCLAPMADVDHLVSHMLESYFMGSLIRNAYVHKRYGSAELVLWMDVGKNGSMERVRTHIRNYLRAVVIPHGIPAISWEALEYLKVETKAEVGA